MKVSLHKLFLEQSAPLPPPKKSFRQFYLKAEGHSISEHPGLIPWSKNLRRNYCVNLDNAVLLPQKNALVALFLDLKPYITVKKENHNSKWLTQLERYDETIFLAGIYFTKFN